MSDAPTTRLLLAEDDPVSRRFLADALHGLGCAVDAHGDGEAALRAARDTRYALLILDLGLPVRHGAALLAALRADPRAASRDTPAVATSAELDAARRRELLTLGFAAALAKPLTIDALRGMLRDMLSAHVASPLLDDEGAAAASGDADTVRALRRLFAGELAALAGELDGGTLAGAALRDRLHRMRAGAGFCGATALDEAAAALAAALRDGDGNADAALQRFRAVLQATRDALSAMG
ncbi:two-component system response regulator protein [Mizugakiibacter sediminis]|uniref:Two-component system response regulator protein n=1 Tax=Mizugakiibacter sediminis TaxID=1475481 RepID=A0A0K8QJ83_9GAMM|nr:response regulator [Mizugakiibacter sediminis]GAP64746.1 two-component system response regulator protein [Mizugakiibacter sediminis]